MVAYVSITKHLNKQDVVYVSVLLNEWKLLVTLSSSGQQTFDPNKAVFSPEFTGQRAQTLSYDHTPHLECSDCQYQTLVACDILAQFNVH